MKTELFAASTKMNFLSLCRKLINMNPREPGNHHLPLSIHGSILPIRKQVRKPGAKQIQCLNGQEAAGTTSDSVIPEITKKHGRMKQKNTGCRLIFMWVVSSMLCCIYYMPVSGIKYCTTSDWFLPKSLLKNL